MTDDLATTFDRHRPRLVALAARILGGHGDADDAVQEAWLRLSRAGDDGIDDLGAWLTTVVSRVCLNLLRSRRPTAEVDGAPVVDPGPQPDEVIAANDAVGPALEVLLDRLRPAERVALVLHEVVGMPFDEVAAVLGRSPAAARQLASRGRRRLTGAAPVEAASLRRRRALVDAFVRASASGDVAALVALLDPEVSLEPDAATVRRGAMQPVVGAAAVAEVWRGRAAVAVPATIDGDPGAAYAPSGRPVGLFVFRFDDADARITGIEALTDPEVVRLTDVTLQGPPPGRSVAP